MLKLNHHQSKVLSVGNSFVTAFKNAKKRLAVLIDPDMEVLIRTNKLLEVNIQLPIDYFFVGGSLILHDHLEQCLELIQSKVSIPTVLFPGSHFQVSEKADAILFLSLLSGRNPDYLIGQQVIAAPYIKHSGLEAISTSYLLVDGGMPTTVSYISNTTPIPNNKPSIAAATAIAGEMLGQKVIYLDAGSGAQMPVPAEMVRAVRESVGLPIIVGGGIKTPEKARNILEAGADIIVVGDAIEKDPGLVIELGELMSGLR